MTNHLFAMDRELLFRFLNDTQPDEMATKDKYNVFYMWEDILKKDTIKA